MKRKRLPSLAKLTRKLDELFSKWIRGRDAPSGLARCYTCNRYAVLEASHFIPRQHQATRWDERNVHGCCSYCNRWQHGALDDYFVALEREYGRSVVNELMRMKRTTVKYARADLEAMIKKYSIPSP